MKIEIPLLCRSKKNSQRIVWHGNKTCIIQSQTYLEFAQNCGYFLKKYARYITTPINLKCTFIVPDKRKRDISNLLNAIQDILVKYKVIADDNYNIVASVDGTRIKYVKGVSKTIIEIEEVTNDNV